MRKLVSGLVVVVALAALSLVPARAEARDIYKAFLDPGIPHHKAILDTLEKLKADPKSAALKNDLGCLIAWDGFWRDALREFNEAAKLDEKDGRPYFNSGLVRAWKGEWSGARRMFRKAVDRNPGNWSAWWMLGYAEERLGSTSAAVEAYKVSLRVDTSLFDPAVNPFAASTQLRARVLLETYDKRVVRASMPLIEQYADPDRVAGFFQRSRSAPAVAATNLPEETSTLVGPVVTSTAPSTTSPAPAQRTSSPPGVRQIPRRQPAPPEEPPAAAPDVRAPTEPGQEGEKSEKGEKAEEVKAAPGPGFGGEVPVIRKPRPTPEKP